MPDPVVERTRRHIDYDPSQLDQSGAPRSMHEIRPGHFILATDSEMKKYEERVKELEERQARLADKQ